jgi:hypothetical protein
MTYGSPLLQALVGLDPKESDGSRRPVRDAVREQARQARRAELEGSFDKGGTLEAMLRSVLYVLKGEGGADERNFIILRELHEAQPPGGKRTMAELKTIIRDQSLLVRIDEERAIAAIPGFLPADKEQRTRALQAIQRIVSAQGELSDGGRKRLARIEKLIQPKSRSTKTGRNG